MAPETRPSIPGAPAALPPISAQSDAGGLNPAYAASAAPAAAPAGASASDQAIAQTKQLISQYGNDPYKMASALQQLKADYLQKRYGIDLKAEN